MTKKISSSKKKIGSISLQNPSEIISPCRKALSKLLDDKNISFSQLPLARPLSEFALRGSGATEAFVERKRYFVLPWESISNEIYWLGLTLQLKFEAGLYYLSGISILVVKGLASDSEKTAILRAEWDCLEEHLIQKHGQPHWHVYPSSIIKNWNSNDFLEIMTNPKKDFGNNLKRTFSPDSILQWLQDGT